jgi:hypothetical protein
MSIDGATHLEEVQRQAWEKLAGQVGFAPRFLDQRVVPFVDGVVEAATRLAGESEHEEPPPREIAKAVQARAERFRP